MELDFTIIKDINPRRILFLDTSFYNKAPISPKLHIKFPNFNKEYITPVQYSEINILNTERLGFTDCAIDFQDGVYTFTYEVNNRDCELTKKIFITTQAYNKLNTMLQNIDVNNKETLEKYNKINLYLHAAESLVCTNETQAEALYKQAENLLKCADVTKIR